MVPPSPGQLLDHQNLLSDIHTQFQAWVGSSNTKKDIDSCVEKVRQQRGDRLKPSAEEEAFSGAAFSGVSSFNFILLATTSIKFCSIFGMVPFVQVVSCFMQDRAVDMGLADGTYEVLEETVTSLLEKEEETLKFVWMRPHSCKSGGILRRLLVKGEEPDMSKLNIPNTIDLDFN